MAPRTATKTTPAKATAPAPVAEEKAAATFDWDALSDPSVMVYSYAKSGPASVDWEKETPVAIKTRVTESFNAYGEALKREQSKICESAGVDTLNETQEKRAQELAGRAASRIQRLPSLAAAEEFLRLARGYAGSIGLALRSGKLTEESFAEGVKTVENGQERRIPNAISYRVRTKEVRTRTA